MRGKKIRAEMTRFQRLTLWPVSPTESMFCSRPLLLPSLQSLAMTRCLQCDVPMGNLWSKSDPPPAAPAPSSKLNPPPAAPSPSSQYVDPFLGRTLRIHPDQRAQVDAPLHVIATAAARLHLPRGHPLALELPPPPSGYMRVALWPAQLQRAAIGFAAAARHGLATAPASVDVSARTTWHWRTRILRRVMGGCVGRIQVARCECCRALFQPSSSVHAVCLRAAQCVTFLLKGCFRRCRRSLPWTLR